MPLNATKTSIALVGLLLVVSLVPASLAEPPSVVIAVSAESADVDELPENVEVVRVKHNQFSQGQLKKYDALVVDADSLATAWENPGKRQAIERFLTDHRALVIEGDLASFERFSDVVAFPGGEDEILSAEGAALPVAATALGVYRTSTGSWDFATFDYGSSTDFTGALVSDTADWINSLRDFQPRAGEPFTAEAADSANWRHWGSASYSYTWSPYGKIGYGADFYYAKNDDSSSFDWWNIGMSQTTYPGTYLWGNGWHTNMGWMTGDQNYYVSSNHLVDWGPGSYDATGYSQWLGYEVGMRQGVMNAPITSTDAFGHTIEDMVVTQASNPDTEYAYVRHEFGYDSGPANGVWTNKGAWTVRTGEGVCLKVPYQNKAEWREYSSASYYTTWINSWREICK